MPDDDRIQEIVRGALERRAATAPSEHGLAARVRARLARRRRRQVAGATVACLALVVGFVGVTQLNGSPGDGDHNVAEPDRGDQVKSPEEWRWESYGGVQVQVPAPWGYGTTGQPPCLPDASQGPYVGRPGVVAMIGCPDPLPELDQRAPYLWFDSVEPVGVRRYDAGWVSETRNVSFMRITVLTDDADLRQRIFGSIRTEWVDSYGCPGEHPVIAGIHARPRPVDGGLATVGDVESISVCRYQVVETVVDPSHGPLLSSSRLTEDAARDLVRDMLDASEGSGPNDPGSCQGDGDEVILLQLRGGDHEQSVFVHYSGCTGHSVDDGAVKRRLTAPVLRALLTGPHRPDSLHGPVAELLDRR